MPEYGDPGWQVNDFGHSSYLEFLVYMNVSTGFFNFFSGSGFPVLVQGPFFSDYQIWIDRFKKEFDPRGLSNPPAPYDPETFLEEIPKHIATKARRIIKTARRG